MALSMDEQRILDQIERGLASSDPMLASRMASFGAPRGPLTARMRRIRLLASFSTLLVVAVMSLVVYAIVPFRASADRPAGQQGQCVAGPPGADGAVRRDRQASHPGQLIRHGGQPGAARGPLAVASPVSIRARAAAGTAPGPPGPAAPAGTRH